MGLPLVAVKATTPVITAVVFIPDCIFVTIPPIFCSFCPLLCAINVMSGKDILITPPEREKS